METLNKNGKVYQVGRLYCTETGTGILTGFHEEDNCFEIENNGQYTYCSAIDNIRGSALILGTIEDAPIELEHGELYWFQCKDLGGCSGFYDKSRRAFLNCGNKVCGEGQAENIKHMVRAK